MAKDSWNPGQYDKFKSERSQPFFDLLGLVHPVPGGRVTDLGCGTGELTAELHARTGAATTVGIDSSDAMLAKARVFSTDDLSFEKGDVATWRERDAYDVIFSNAALQWCGDHPGLFRRLREALREGGQLAVQMPMNHDYPTHVLAAEMNREEPWRGLLGAESYNKQENLLTPEGYATLLYSLGFREQTVIQKVYCHVLESREGVIEWVKGTLLTHFQSRLSPVDYARFLEEFRARLFARVPDDKPFFYPFKRILLWARR